MGRGRLQRAWIYAANLSMRKLAMELTLDLDVLKQWVGNQGSMHDVMHAKNARLMQTTLDRAADLEIGDPLPPLFHWLYFASETPMSGLGRDGHRALGRFLPPVALPRRMWAGGRLTFIKPILLGDAVEKISAVHSVDMKDGRSGKLCFVTVRHSFAVNGEERLSEDHDIVYREAASAYSSGHAASETETATPQWSREIDPSPTLLFRYSALTFNGHRIHYDADFCRDEEGYPGLVVHGPLIASLLADLAVQSTGKPLASFEFRASSPLFNTTPFAVHGLTRDDGTLQLWAATGDGRVAMRATAGLQA